MTRYAVYYAPSSESSLHAFGCAWLGRDPVTGAPAEPLPIAGFSAEQRARITALPHRYGFHATLKAPFALGSGRTPEELERVFTTFAASREPFAIDGLQLAVIGGFLALTLHGHSEQFTALAAAAVELFDPFRAPMSHEERARRDQGRLDARQRELLAAWGYPYVFERWRFHLTLTGPLDEEERATVRAALEPLVEPFATTAVTVDAVSLFVQPAPDEPFSQRDRFMFHSRAERSE
jgi:putative phosphonate metabolism protein